MRISTRTRYALRALLEIAAASDEHPVQAREIARRQAIPPRYLEQVLAALLRGGLLASQRGPRGGYALGAPAARVTLGDLVRAVEGGRPPEPTDGREPPGGAAAVTAAVWRELAARMARCLETITLDEVCRRAAAAEAPADTYCI